VSHEELVEADRVAALENLDGGPNDLDGPVGKNDRIGRLVCHEELMDHKLRVIVLWHRGS